MRFDNRVKTQGFTYDFAGNTIATSDDEKGFYDRSLGTITNGTANAGPHQLKSAAIVTGSRTGTLAATYDVAGNMTRLAVDRNGAQCTASGGCSHVYKYEWDEMNRLQRARRWDLTDVNADSPPAVTDASAAVDLRHRYDADDNRIIKAAYDPPTGDTAYTLYVFGSLDIRRTSFNASASGEYAVTEQTEVPYLTAHGVRLARVIYDPGEPVSSPTDQHVFLELGDHLGSTSTVLDKATGELVEKATYQAYGGAEGDYRPGRWKAFREDYRFTGKEEDVEVGLTYFGKRFLNPLLGRWCSPDPLGVHAPGEADLNLYAYVHGMALKAVDPLGLETTVTDSQNAFGGTTRVSASDDVASVDVHADGSRTTTMEETSYEVGMGAMGPKSLPGGTESATGATSEYDPIQTRVEARRLPAAFAESAGSAVATIGRIGADVAVGTAIGAGCSAAPNICLVGGASLLAGSRSGEETSAGYALLLGGSFGSKGSVPATTARRISSGSQVTRRSSVARWWVLL